MKITIPIMTTVSINDIEQMDLEQLNHIQLLEVAVQLIEALKHTNTLPVVKKPILARKKGQGLGVKRGKTSKYHYVDCIKGKYRARVTISGVTHHLGIHASEIDAGRSVDGFLDEIGDTKRPRNRDEFEELQAVSYFQEQDTITNTGVLNEQ